MKKIMRHLIVYAGLLSLSNTAKAQEVFFKDNTTKLQTIHPSYYYPMRYGQGTALHNYMEDKPSAKLSVVNGEIAGKPDRFGNNSEAVFFTSNAGLALPYEYFHDAIVNKTVNMSFWASYDRDVFEGKEDGVIFSITSKTDLAPKVVCKIHDKKIVLYTQRKTTTGTTVLVPIVNMDFPLEDPGADTNNNFFFSITSSSNPTDGKRTRIYISKPGGALYTRSYYIYPFDNVNEENDRMIIGGGIAEQGKMADSVDDLMLFGNEDFATRIMTPENVLNNFYLQSPLYEGISYEMTNLNKALALESERNNGVALAEEYIISSELDNSKTPFGYNRFNVETSADWGARVYNIKSMKMGGSGLALSTNSYAYMGHLRDANHYTYRRLVSNPSTMYTVNSNQFNLQSKEGKFLRMYLGGGKYYLAEDNTGPSLPSTQFGISAAVKVFRGPERSNASGTVRLDNYTLSEMGHSIGYDVHAISWNYIGLQFGTKPFLMHKFTYGGGNTYLRSYFETAEGFHHSFISRYNGNTDITDGNRLISIGNQHSYFEFVYVKDDANGKPMYMMRTADGNVAFKLTSNSDHYTIQSYQDALNSDGTVSNNYLWEIKKD